MSYLLDSYFDKASDFLYPWKSVTIKEEKEECISRWSKWSPVFTTPTGRPFQVRVDLDSHLVEYSEMGIILDDLSIKQVTDYMKEVSNDDSVS
jgi:hypothetical protein